MSLPSQTIRVPPGKSLAVKIAPVIAQAEALAARVRRDMPTHPGLASLADGVARSAYEAQRVAQRLRRLIGLHRLPAFFVATVLALVCWLVYHETFRVNVLSVGMPDRDSVRLRSQVDRRVQFKLVKTEGSTDGLRLLERGALDVAMVQGGIEVPPGPDGTPWLVREMPGAELVLCFTRGGIEPGAMRRILTSTKDQGSHTVAQQMVRCWGTAPVTYLHDWTRLTGEAAYQVPADVDGVLVVKDAGSEDLDPAVRKLVAAGFQLVQPNVGGHQARLTFLKDAIIKPGYLSPAQHIPAVAVPSYAIATVLVVHPRLGPRQLAAVESLARDRSGSLLGAFELNLNTTSDLLQGVEAALGILVYIGIAFLAVLGLDVYTYQSRFSELNSLVSLITMHQSSRGAIQSSPQRRAEEVAYLRVCSDLLGLISVITGYYTQQNSSLTYNATLEVIHNRSSSMKLNIQLKILHALIDLPGALLESEDLPAPAVPVNAETR